MTVALTLTNLFVCALIFIIGFCMVASGFVSDIEEQMTIKKKKEEKKTQLNTGMKLINIIRFHSEAKQLCNFIYLYYFIYLVSNSFL